MSDVVVELAGGIGRITLARPKALNALSLDMVRALTSALLEWRDDPQVRMVAVRGMGKEGPFGAFCAGGDIRFFHQAALAGDPRLEDFFTEEYALNHLVHTYPKPYVAILDGIVMGGGMGIAGHGARNSLRIATERMKMAMPETNIGLFPDVGGGWFLPHCCPGRVAEYLALTGDAIGGKDAVALGLADAYVASAQLDGLWAGMQVDSLRRGVAEIETPLGAHRADIDQFFGLPTVGAIILGLEAATSEWARATAATLRKRSPLMLHVVLEQVRRGRGMSLADDLRMERDMVRNCFWLRPGAASETVEGIRALAMDKDHAPRWNPPRIEDVTPDMVDAFFTAPWPEHAHPLRTLA